MRFLVWVLLIVLTSSSVLSQSSTANQSLKSSKLRSKVSSSLLPQTPIEQFTLSNGLRVVFGIDRSRPVVSVAVYYDVGSRNEKPGRTGFAHLFEHMMFQGSENVGKAEHFQYIYNAGGTKNGTTSTERTNYFETLPANQLPLALWLESDRMRSLKVTQENLDNQRNAVQEEKRLRYDNQPYGNAFLKLNELIYKNPANAHSTIGSMEDLDAATVEDVREFFRIYYAPNNAVLSIAGDFDTKEARGLVEKYFGSIPRQPTPPAVNVSEPEEVSGKSEKMMDRFAQLPAFLIGWKIPPRRSKDFYSLALANALLLDGESSRLYQKLVKGEESLIAIQGGIDSRRGPSSFYLFGLPKPGKSPDQIRSVIFSEIRKLATEEPSEAEMEKLRNSLLNDAVRNRQTSLFRAQRLAEFLLYDNDPNLFNTDLENYLKVTPADIRNSVARYINTENRALLEIIPAGEKAAPTAPKPAGEPRQPASPPPQEVGKPQPPTGSQPTTAPKPAEQKPSSPENLPSETKPLPKP
jgi:zinc protease